MFIIITFIIFFGMRMITRDVAEEGYDFIEGGLVTVIIGIRRS